MSKKIFYLFLLLLLPFISFQSTTIEIYNSLDDIVPPTEFGSLSPLPYNIDDNLFESWANIFNSRSDYIPHLSPINIKWYNYGGGINYPLFPLIKLNGTYYNLLNTYNFTWFYIRKDLDTKYADLKIVLPEEDISTAIVDYNTTKLKYKLHEIRLKLYSEHSFEGMKADLEFQLIHKIKNISSSTLDSIRTSQQLPTPSKYMAVSVLFSAAMDKHSDFIEEIIENEPDEKNEVNMYRFAKLKGLDFNQFTDQHDPYYFYKGAGTSPRDFNEEMDWYVMKKVNYMSDKQLRKIQLIVSKVYYNGNSLSHTFDSDNYAGSARIKFKYANVEYHRNEENGFLYK